MSKYILWINDTQSGPFTMTQLKSMWLDGRITSATLFWREDSQDWSGLGSVVEDAIASEKRPPSSQVAHQEKGWTTVDFVILVVCTLLIPIAGLIVGFVGVFNPAKRQRAATLMGLGLLGIWGWWMLVGR